MYERNELKKVRMTGNLRNSLTRTKSIHGLNMIQQTSFMILVTTENVCNLLSLSSKIALYIKIIVRKNGTREKKKKERKREIIKKTRERRNRQKHALFARQQVKDPEGIVTIRTIR